MADKTNIDSGLYMQRNKPLPHQLAAGHPASSQQASHERSELNLFDAFRGLKFKRFQHFASSLRGLLNAAAPYFIHIVRANRARDMIGRCPGACQAGQQEKQTVAG